MEAHGILPALLGHNETLDQPSGEDLERLGQAGGKYAAQIARLGLKGSAPLPTV